METRYLVSFKSNSFRREYLPLYPVPSGSTCAAATLPFSILRAYLLLLGPPKMAVPSKSRSRALVNEAEGSPRKRIYPSSAIAHALVHPTYTSLLRGVQLLGPSLHPTPRQYLLDPNARALAYTNESLTETTNTLPALLSLGEFM